MRITLINQKKFQFTQADVEYIPDSSYTVKLQILFCVMRSFLFYRKVKRVSYLFVQ